MTTVDERLKELGFELIKQDDACGIAIYEKVDDDHRVELNDCGEEFFIHSTTISEDYDDFGQLFRRPMGMSYDECKAFLDKIEELKRVWKW